MNAKVLNNALWMLVGAGLAIGAVYGHDLWKKERAKASPETLVIEAVKRSLKDPESARFEKVTFNEKTKFGCGWVNAKNAMGGYVGLTRFVFYQPDGSVEFEPQSSSSGSQAMGDLAKRMAFLEHAKEACGTTK